MDSLDKFCADLKELWNRCGPVLKNTEKFGLSKSRAGEILNGESTQLPPWPKIDAILRACADAVRDSGQPQPPRLSKAYWSTRYQELAESITNKKPNRWAKLAEEHTVWPVTADAEQFRTQVIDTAGQLFDRYQRMSAQLEGDRWLDDGLAVRMTERLQHLIATIAPVEFSVSEAVLLVLTPLLHQTRVTEALVDRIEVGPTDLRVSGAEHRKKYEKFLGGSEQQRLVARAKLPDLPGRANAAKEIAWWLFHQWVGGLQEQSTDGQSVPMADHGLRKMLADTVDRLIHVLRLSADDLRNDERRNLRPEKSHLGITAGRQVVRESLVGFLLVAAHKQAFERALLPTTLVEHLGIPKPVVLDQLGTTIDTATWETVQNFGIGLYADCDHEAVLEALRAHVARTDEVLGAIHATSKEVMALQPLLRLPNRATSDFVVPTEKSGQPAFVTPVTRFRLDETRVRELLMGEQLYGDRSLAIRELYQNALDACRYREARYRYENALHGTQTGWSGRVQFTQGEEDGRLFIRCVDNGVGMGKSELREVFSQAGTRFADRREFLEEKAEWESKGVQMFPNSRFGIGVLSYFMLADEIEVVTRRMSRHNPSPVPALRVMIAGPGHLFSIEPDEELGDSGTTVTLYLRDEIDAPSSVEVLQRLLGIAEFETTAEQDGFAPVVWRPFELKGRAGLSGEAGIHVNGARVPGRLVEDEGQVVWCEEGGALLTDGIHVQEAKTPNKFLWSNNEVEYGLTGAVVNLMRRRAPQLTVNRTSILEDVSDEVTELLTAAVPELLRERPSFFTFDWLCNLAKSSPAVADIISSVATEHGTELTTGDGSVIAMATAGCFPTDRHLVNRLRPRKPFRYRSSTPHDHILLWRILALDGGRLLGAHEPQGRTVLPALPTDSEAVDINSFRDEETPRVRPGRLAAGAASLMMHPNALVDRLRVLGYKIDRFGELPDHHRSFGTDARILSRDVDGTSPWLDPGNPMTIGHVIAAQERVGQPVSQVLRQLSRYGFDVSHLTYIPQRFNQNDNILASVEATDMRPWREHGATVYRGFTYYCAYLLRQDVASVVERLTELGFVPQPVHDTPQWIDEIRPDVRPLLTAGPELLQDGVVAAAQVTRAAVLWDISPYEAAHRLADLGFPMPHEDWMADRLDEVDTQLLPIDWMSETGLKGSPAVSLRRLLLGMRRTGLSLRQVAARLAEFGFTLPPDEILEHELDNVDRELVNMDHPYRGRRLIDHPDRTFADIAEAAHRLAVSVSEVAHRMNRMGFEVGDLSHFAGRVAGTERVVLTVGDGVLGSYRPGSSISLAFIAQATDVGRSTPQAVADCLAGMGFEVPGAALLPDRFDPTDLSILALVDLSSPVSVSAVLQAVLKHEMPIEEVIDRLTALGLETPDMAAELPKLLERVPFLQD